MHLKKKLQANLKVGLIHFFTFQFGYDYIYDSHGLKSLALLRCTLYCIFCRITYENGAKNKKKPYRNRQILLPKALV